MKKPALDAAFVSADSGGTCECLEGAAAGGSGCLFGAAAPTEPAFIGGCLSGAAAVDQGGRSPADARSAAADQVLAWVLASWRGASVDWR